MYKDVSDKSSAFEVSFGIGDSFITVPLMHYIRLHGTGPKRAQNCKILPVVALIVHHDGGGDRKAIP